MRIQHGGSLGFMILNGMMTHSPFLRNSWKFELIVLDLGCWQEILT
jgi:hypothetical protein